MNDVIIVKRAAMADAESIKNIITEAFLFYKEKAYLQINLEALNESIEDIRNDIQNKNVYVAFYNEIPVGSIRVELLQDHTAYISRFGVSLEYHNLGIGKTLMNFVDQVLISERVKTVFLYTASKNTELMRFYYGRGFYIQSTSDDKGYIRALMVKEYY